MHNTSTHKEVYSGGKELIEQVEQSARRHPNQKDDAKHFFYFSQNLSLSRYADSNAVNVMADYIIEQSDYSPSQQSYKDLYRHHVILIILNLSRCIMHRQFCKIPLDAGAFGKGNSYDKLSYKNFRRAIDVLDALGFIELIKGAKYSAGGQRSVMQPASVMSRSALYAYLESEDWSDPPYVKVSKQGESGHLSPADIEQIKIDEKDMLLINDFLRSHTWAAKSSIRRLYSGRVGSAGRLYCSYQQLPKRRIPIRNYCLIDGEPLVEVDLKASHPRLAVALFHGEKLEREFYDNVFEATDVFQSKVKAFCQNAFSCDSRLAALNSFKKNKPNGNEKDFNEIETYMLSRFPKLPYYSSWSLIAMNYEGEIIKKVMLEGVRNNIVVLPVHDAVAVQTKHKEWAEKTMIRCWNEIVGFDGCEVD